MAGPLGTPDNILPNPLVVEPLIVGDAVWSGQTGVGSVELSFPYTRPLDPIPAIEKMDSHTYHRPPECVFCATTNMTTNDFNVETGLITLHPYVQADSQNNWTVGSADTPPVADAEFRACYTKFDPTTYLPTIMSIPLYGASIHKVFVPVLARIVNDPVCTSKGLIFRKNELVLLVLTRLGPTNPQSGYCLSVENNILFNENKSAACVGVYRTQNLLMVVGDR
jgi:hypothetical protein